MARFALSPSVEVVELDLTDKKIKKQKFVVTQVITVANTGDKPVTKKEVRNAVIDGALAFDFDSGHHAIKVSVRSVDED